MLFNFFSKNTKILSNQENQERLIGVHLPFELNGQISTSVYKEKKPLKAFLFMLFFFSRISQLETDAVNVSINLCYFQHLLTMQKELCTSSDGQWQWFRVLLVSCVQERSTSCNPARKAKGWRSKILFVFLFFYQTRGWEVFFLLCFVCHLAGV